MVLPDVNGGGERQLPLPERTPVLKLCGISKRFAGVVALREVDLTLARGEVHALLGENGAGKSTLMKIMFGIFRPTDGTIELDDIGPVKIADPRHALSLGIGLVSQELSLVPQLDVAQNIFLGRTKGLSVIPRNEDRLRAAEILDGLAPHISVSRKVSELGMADRQLVEIARTISRGGRVIAFDEPTSSLTPAEKNALFDTIRRLRDNGAAIVYISHRMSEVREIADRVTVLRDGKIVAHGPTADFTVDELNEHVAGRKLRSDRSGPGKTTTKSLAGPARLSMRGVCTQKLRDVSLEIRDGEILGLAGLVGSGRTSIMRTLFGLAPITDGQVELAGVPFAPQRPAEAIARGVALIPEDRRDQSIIPMASVEQNFGLANLKRHSRAGFLPGLSRSRAFAGHIEALDIRPRRSDLPIQSLSGGNQQKVVIARWLETGAQLMLFDEPTRGIDVGAKSEIHALLRRLANEGVALLVASSELQEVLAVADRIAIVRSGRVVDILPNDGTLDEDRLLELASKEETNVH